MSVIFDALKKIEEKNINFNFSKIKTIDSPIDSTMKSSNSSNGRRKYYKLIFIYLFIFLFILFAFIFFKEFYTFISHKSLELKNKIHHEKSINTNPININKTDEVNESLNLASAEVLPINSPSLNTESEAEPLLSQDLTQNKKIEAEKILPEIIEKQDLNSNLEFKSESESFDDRSKENALLDFVQANKEEKNLLSASSPSANFSKNHEKSSDQLLNNLLQLYAMNQFDNILALLATKQAEKNEYLSTVKRFVDSLLNLKKNTDSIQILNQAILFYPEDIDLRQMLASAEFNLQNYNEAIKLLLEKHPDIINYPRYYILLAALYLKVSNYKDAALLYNALSQVRPDDADIYLGLAISYQAEGDQTLSKAYYEKALSLASETWASRGFVLKQLEALGYS